MTLIDPALRDVLRFAGVRRLYGTVIGDFPHVRAVLAGVFTDALTSDAAPDPAASHWLLDGAMRDLSVVFGARGYLRTGEGAAFDEVLASLRAAAPARGMTGREFDEALGRAAEACFAYRREAARSPGASDFLAGDVWLRAVLHRTADRRSGRIRPLPTELTDPLMTELALRLDRGDSFGILGGRP